MAVATVERPQPQPHPQYRLHPGMMGMYIFLTSEVMFFGSMFAMYFYLFGSHPFGWPPPNTAPVDWFPIPAVNTFILLTSGVTCHFALDSISHRGRPGSLVGAALLALGAVGMAAFGVAGFGYRGGVATYMGILSALIGAACIVPMLGVGPFTTGRPAFLALLVGTILLGVLFEFGQAYEFVNAHITFGGLNEFGSAFFTMTGFHGAHVMGGLILLLVVLWRATKGHWNAEHHVGVAAVTLYWHFVDVVWIALFGILYLAVTAVPH